MFRADSEPVEVELFRVVNVEEHPHLRAPALSGTLHHLDDGEELAVPFVFHDPAARQFVLVIPEGSKSLELSERSKLLERLMREDEREVPAYVRRFAIAYGNEGLARHLEEVQRIEVEIHELEPIDVSSAPASYFPRLGGLLPDAEIWPRAGDEMATLLDDEMLWAFIRVAEEAGTAFAESNSDLLLQLKTVDGAPVCILALVDTRRGAVRRAYLNPTPSADRPILQLLRSDFRAAVVVVDEKGRLRQSFCAAAPRTANAQMILDRTEHAPSSSRARWWSTVEACRRAPPPIGPGDHPFVVREGARTAADALERLRALEAWTTPERVDEALLVRSIPRMVFETSRHQIVRDAFRFGLAMSDSLLFFAVRSGCAADSSTMVRSLGERFAQIVPVASEHGLDAGQIEANWAALSRLSELHGTSTDNGRSCTMEHSG